MGVSLGFHIGGLGQAHERHPFGHETLAGLHLDLGEGAQRNDGVCIVIFFFRIILFFLFFIVFFHGF